MTTKVITRMPFTCRLGFHKWSKWISMDAPFTLLKSGKTIMIRIQSKVCASCGREETREL